jgi:proteasome lid subunit RPN8/RPN11
LSADEIIFGEMRVREPERRQRPDQDRRFACLACDLPAAADLPIFLDRKAADAIERHAHSDTSVELGGILLGKECLDPSSGQPFVWITQSLEAKHYANTQASFTYTHDSWEEITRERDRLHPECDIVGWYHTHPNFGIFLSHHDQFIHQHFFAQPLQVAYVVDPINVTRGFFQWRQGGLAQVGGFYLAAPRTERQALARLANELESVPNSEGSAGGGFSPRLEAELINMLTRPAHREIGSPVERAQIAMVFGMLGAMLGVLGVAASLWLYQLHGRIVAVNDSLATLNRSVEQVASGQRLAVDTLLEKAGTEDPAKFAQRYSKVAKERDDALRQLDVQRTINDALGAKAKDLEVHATTLAADLDDARKKLLEYEKERSDYPALRDRLLSLEETNADQKKQLEEAAPFLDSAAGKAAVAVQRELVRTQYAAYGGWASAALLGLGLVAAYLYYKPLTEDAPSAGQPAPHRIE